MSRKAEVNPQLVRGGLLVWAALVAGFFLWQAYSYRGFAARAAEWEYGRFGTYFPTATLLFFVVIFASPVLYLLSRRAWRQSRSGRSDAAVSWRILVALGGLSILCLIAALVSFALTVPFSRDGGAPMTVTVGRSGAPTVATGAATLTGRIRYDRVAELNRNVLVARQKLFFVPVEAADNGKTSLTYFAALDTPKKQAEIGTLTGVLRRNGLPGDVIALYRQSGYAVAEPHYVLYPRASTIAWPYYVTAAKFALAGLVLGLAALLQWRVGRRRRGDAT